MDSFNTSEALAHILDTCNLRDLTSEVQLLGVFPVFVTSNYSIGPAKLRGENDDVAIKLLRPTRTAELQKDSLHEFVREAVLWSRAMHHDNVIPLLGVARLNDSVAFVSPWMRNGNLAIYLKVHQDAHVEQLFADVACGLAHLHALDIIYGIPCSSTVLVSDTGRASLSSFLLAHTHKGNKYGSTEMLKWRVDSLVTFHFEDAYEDESRTPAITPETDVSAFGTLIIESLKDRHLSGHSPPLQDAPAFNNRLDGDPVRPESLPGLSDGLWSIVLDCWKKEPEERLSMAEVARRMGTLAQESARTPSWNAVSLEKPLPYAEDPQASSSTLTDISAEIRRLGEHPIAGGGYGDLYLGERRGSEKVALKLVRFYGESKQDPNAARRRFLSEAWLWAGLDHQRILKFYGICKHGNFAYFMVSPFLKNGNIMDYLAYVNPDADRRQLLLEAAEGLLYLHTRFEPVVHGDIKGGNILITDSGSAVLTDFGLSKFSHQATTLMLQGAGSPRWMAPELVLATDNVTGPLKSLNSDIYAFGHAMLEIYSNKTPFFDIKEDLHVLIAMMRGMRAPRPDGPIADRWLDDQAWEFSCRCTAINPEERPDIQAVVSELCRPSTHQGSSSKSTGVSP